MQKQRLKRLQLPKIFKRLKEEDFEDDGAYCKMWTYKDKVKFCIAYYNDDPNIVYFVFDGFMRMQKLPCYSKVCAFANKFEEVSREAFFNPTTIRELESVCEKIYQEM